ncbi:MAG: DUF1553 domain-containing protein [Acidobacteria bacterium]|nr:DUF1553 domain-containing protein [Acidobacteriota bacterium]
MAAYAADSKVDFNRDVRPLLSDNCFACHGPDDSTRMAGLRLDTREGVQAALPKIVPRLTHANVNLRMPPRATGKVLNAAQVELLRRWVAEGAEFKLHWAYEAPVRPPLPVSKNKWARNGIDNFVLARLEKEGLKPSEEAGRVTLLRRLALDLTGLPPTPAEVDAFLRDRSADAYEKQVDRLLASPHYGEKLALHWLDLARYADTHGFHIDSHRDMWPWRDWLIAAFNKNMPFDRFTIEQLAGDLLPNATVEQKIASGFNRNHMINYEGGAIPEEYLIEYVADRAETTATVWMAMTMGCARCHDHKYDPIKQKDFYSFFAFFNGVKEKGLDGRDGNADPVLRLHTPEQKRREDFLNLRIRGLEETTADEKVKPLVEAFEKGVPRVFSSLPAVKTGLVAHYEMDGTVHEHSGGYRHGQLHRGELSEALTSVGRATVFTAPSHVTFFDPRWSETYSIAAWLVQGHHEPQTVFQAPGLDVWWDASEPLPHLRRGAHLHVATAKGHLRTASRLVQGEQYHVTISHTPEGGATIRVNGAAAAVVREESAPLPAVSAFAIGQAAGSDRHGFRGRIADLRLYSRALQSDEAYHLATHHRLSHMVDIPVKARPRELTARLRDYYLSEAAPVELRAAAAELRKLKAEQAALNDEIANTMVMADLDKPRETFMLARGDYRNKGEKVGPATPGVLPPLGAQGSVDRLALARWLVDPKHPLTARVAVNRFWQNLFGIGLVKSSENFGTQGEPPSHPELLDWLAAEFSAKWDVKALHRMIVTSATYRQTSAASPGLVERDPENRLLARMSRFRLPAELVRDNALASAGLLNAKIGGPSSYPYQPEGIWEEIARGEIFSAQVYKESTGDDLYRRGMYWFWKRTAPPAPLTTFDAPDREKCVPRRSVTNTPLQALVLMNDPAFVEAARVLAQNTLRSAGAADRLTFAFRRVTGRAPSSTEAVVLNQLAARQLERYRNDAPAAKALLSVGKFPVDTSLAVHELAAWTNVASVLLNLDEVITKE